MNDFPAWARSALTFAVCAFIAACTSAPPSQVQSESLLSAAGFKTVVASTDKQLQQLPSLPAGQVTVVTQTGKNWFVYPDLAKNRVYVGTQKEYQTYLKLRAQNNLPDVDPIASYFKRDAAMTAASARDAGIAPVIATSDPSIPPWDGWPDFGGLGW